MIHGVLNIYKEAGFTSHDVVSKLRGILGQRKVGHTGTLDPDATGVLPVCLGKATKLCDMLTDSDKMYEAVLLLGMTTDTQDLSGKMLSAQDCDHLSEEVVTKAILSFIGTYAQVPPMYSALKVNGRKLYELAREGKTIERKARNVIIYQIRILESCLPRVRISVTCSKGTYIRTLCHDIGEKLDVGGCMESLIRTKAGRFTIAGSIRLSEVEKAVKSGRVSEILTPVDQMFAELPSVLLNEEGRKLAYNGNTFLCCHIKMGDPAWECSEQLRVYDWNGVFIGIFHYFKERGIFQVQKMFLEPQEMNKR